MATEEKKGHLVSEKGHAFGLLAIGSAIVILFAITALTALTIPPAMATSPPVKSETVTFYATASDGDVYKKFLGWGPNDEPLFEVRVEDDSNSMKMAVERAFSSYYADVYRGFLFFDTSSLPDDAIITDATLSLYGCGSGSTNDFNIVVQYAKFWPIYPHDPLQPADFDAIVGYPEFDGYTGNCGSLNISEFSTSGYNDIILNKYGKDMIFKTEMTKFCLRISRDIDGTGTKPGFNEPEQLDWVRVLTNEGGSDYAPKLTVTYTTVNPHFNNTRISGVALTESKGTTQLTPGGSQLVEVCVGDMVSGVGGPDGLDVWLDIYYPNYRTGYSIGDTAGMVQGLTWDRYHMTYDSGKDPIEYPALSYGSGYFYCYVTIPNIQGTYKFRFMSIEKNVCQGNEDSIIRYGVVTPAAASVATVLDAWPNATPSEKAALYAEYSAALDTWDIAPS
jgi:hypothetical protein